LTSGLLLWYEEDAATVIVEAGVLAGSFDVASGLARFGDPLDEYCGMTAVD
jgi:hypothetical protein